MPNARQKILNYIIEQQSCTVEELSRVFKVTPANIRHHLSILVEQGSLTITGQKLTADRGRPYQIYSYTHNYQQNNLDRLADVLLSTFLKDIAEGELDSILQKIAGKLVEQYPINHNNPTARLYSSIRTLNHMNYHAHWEAHVENPHIMLGHCPYFSIRDQHPEVCRMDRYLIEGLVGRLAKQSEKLIINSKGMAECIFYIE